MIQIKKTIAILTVLLLLLSGCKAVKNNQAGTAATPVTDSQAEQDSQSDISDSEKNKKSEKEVEPVDSNWKETLNWDDSWLNEKPMQNDEVAVIMNQNLPNENQPELFPMTNQERMAYYVGFQKNHQNLKETMSVQSTEDWFLKTILFVQPEFSHNPEDFSNLLLSAFQNVEPEIAKGFTAKIEVSSMYFSTDPIIQHPCFILTLHSDNSKVYTYEEIEVFCDKASRFMFSLQDLSHIMMQPTSPTAYLTTDV